MKKRGVLLGVLGFDRFGVGKKFILLMYIFVIFSMTTVAYYGYQHAGSAYRDKALSVARLGVRDTSRSISDFLRTIPDDLSFVCILSKIQGKRNIFRRDRKQYAEIEMK